MAYHNWAISTATNCTDSRGADNNAIQCDFAPPHGAEHKGLLDENQPRRRSQDRNISNLCRYRYKQIEEAILIYEKINSNEFDKVLH